MAALNFPSNPSDGDTYSANDTIWIYSSSLSKWIRSRQTLATTYIPIGTVIWFSANTPPSGYLECDGSAISRTVYADLFSTIGTTFGSGDGSTTFNLPDLRGEFVRGWDNGRGADSGRGFGSTQSWAIENITGSIEPSGTPNEAVFGEEALTATGAFELEPNESGASPGGSDQSQPGGFNFDASRVVQTADETRPRNVALLPCIRAFGQVDIEGAADLSALLASIATQSEAAAGLDNTKIMTPLRTYQGIIARAATKTEMEAGNDATKLVTPDSHKFASGSIKAWSNFTDTVIRESYNYSSITDTGTGQPRLSMTNAMNTVNYAIQFTGADVSDNTTKHYYNVGTHVIVPTTTNHGFDSSLSSGSYYDSNFMYSQISGDLA